MTRACLLVYYFTGAVTVGAFPISTTVSTRTRHVDLLSMPSDGTLHAPSSREDPRLHDRLVCGLAGDKTAAPSCERGKAVPKFGDAVEDHHFRNSA
jgi:hypothetical protein